MLGRLVDIAAKREEAPANSLGLLVPDAGIKDGKEQIHSQINQDDEERQYHRASLDDGKIAVEDRGDQQAADTGHQKYAHYDEGPAHQPAQGEPHDGNDRDELVLQGVA